MVLDLHSSVQSSTLTVGTDLNEVSRVIAWYEQFKNGSLNSDLWLQGQIALVEGFTNAVRHAHRHLHVTTPIEIDGLLSTQCLRLCIWDHGKPFDFEENLASISLKTHGPEFNPFIRETEWGSIILLKLRNQHNWQISYQHERNLRNCLSFEKCL